MSTIFEEPRELELRGGFERILPDNIAIRHNAYQRRARVNIAHKAGATLTQIGKSMGISCHRVSQLNYRMEHTTKYLPLSPIELYFKYPVYSDWEKKMLQKYIGEFIHCLEQPRRLRMKIKWK